MTEIAPDTSASRRRPIQTRPAVAEDRAIVADVLARAFIDDPAMSWLFPDRADRVVRLARFFRLSTRLEPDPGLWSLALDDGGGIAAATMWRPPGQWKTTTMAMVMHLWPLLRTFGATLPRALSLQSVLEAHHPLTPHWYLQYAGCVPEQQGRGLGGAAIRARLAQCDAKGLPAALETATPGNVGLYQALGFEVTDTFDVPDGPHFWAMWRAPRSVPGRPAI